MTSIFRHHFEKSTNPAWNVVIYPRTYRIRDEQADDLKNNYCSPKKVNHMATPTYTTENTVAC